ncbi:hypothetical protein BS47DRAFT_1346228 [Hydnum rufescens UP504]|uniref:Uncharacterized protein n=1 Tax=Hydnum rufescens UP504 TaxID=1448309 RepID=A0A9P6ATR6_9AGAM|nr:hypothetical protein BS47DRAFT_1346228 [Hydnum rufescens UP504]
MHSVPFVMHVHSRHAVQRSFTDASTIAQERSSNSAQVHIAVSPSTTLTPWSSRTSLMLVITRHYDRRSFLIM